MILIDLDREAGLHRETIGAQQVKESLDQLRRQLTELRTAARLEVQSGDAEAFRSIELRAAELDAELANLSRRAATDASLPTLASFVPAAQRLALHARSIGRTRSAHASEEAAALSRAAESDAAEAVAELELSEAAVSLHINQRTLAQIRVEAGIRKYVTGLLVISMTALGGLVAGYRRVQGRLSEAQRRIEHLAHFDMVTGLPNRALLADRLAREMARSRRSSRGFAVLLFDLDGFKAVNDTWGHAAGDRVLALVGERVRKCVRDSDTVGRLGGDEFLAILPETTREGAMGVADKLRQSLGGPYPLGKGEAKLTVSVGVSLFPEHGGEPEGLQSVADAALYRAKHEGRNRTVVATGAESRRTG
jgi:diguanylate cyclase